MLGWCLEGKCRLCELHSGGSIESAVRRRTRPQVLEQVELRRQKFKFKVQTMKAQHDALVERAVREAREEASKPRCMMVAGLDLV